MLLKRKFEDFAMEDDAGAAIGKDHSCSSGSVLTDYEDGVADYTCGHGGLPSPTVFTRPVPELLGPGTATTATSTSLHKKSGSGGSSSRRAAKRREVTVPIAEIEGMKGGGGDCTAPPDAWTWRKYGQKPIKGSPYPRGYYRCSSSKGCPARKQVERNRLDPTMLVITYASEHNHPLPVPRAHGQPHRATHNQANSRRPGSPVPIPDTEIEEEKEEEVPIVTSASLTNTDGSSPEDSTFTDLGDASSFMPLASDFGWFSGLIETPLPTTRSLLDDDEDVGMMLPMTCSDVAEDDALFAGLGELPECAVVFRRQTMAQHGKSDEGHRCSLTAWCESNGSVR